MRRYALLIALLLGATFIAEPAAAARIIVPSTGPIVVTFDNLAPGAYAIGAYHDENNNDHLDTDMIGLPSEG